MCCSVREWGRNSRADLEDDHRTAPRQTARHAQGVLPLRCTLPGPQSAPWNVVAMGCGRQGGERPREELHEEPTDDEDCGRSRGPYERADWRPDSRTQSCA